LSAELKDGVKFLEEQLSCVKALGHASVHEYASVLGAFGCVTEAVATDAPVFDVLKWFSNNFTILLVFFGEASDFATFSSVTNVLSMLEKAGCRHMGDFHKRSFVFDSPDKLGELSKTVSMASWRFMKEFWV